VFDFERKGETSEPEEDSAPRSILHLEGAASPPLRPSSPALAPPSRTTGSPAPPLSAPASSAPLPPSGGRRRDPLSLSTPSSAVPELEVPEFERDLQPPSRRPIPVERAILLSLGAHILLFLLLRWMPASGGTNSRHGLFGSLFPEPKPVDTIPLVFRSAPGPERANPKRSDPSDKTRRAGGGDPSRAKSETPFVPQRPGIEGLAPGAGKSARAAAARASGDNGERTAAASTETARSTAPDAFAIPPPGAKSSGRAGEPLTDLDRAIRDAAREVGAGESGAGIPNPDGGFLDSGPVSFDTSWYDWGAYADEMVRRIKLHWDVPELARLGWKGRLTVRFYIMADGRVADAKYISKSGVPPFDFAAFQAIIKSDPFRPLPKDLLAQVPGKDREGITVTFFYNMRPGRQ
jgi:TonB family protein